MPASPPSCSAATPGFNRRFAARATGWEAPPPQSPRPGAAGVLQPTWRVEVDVLEVAAATEPRTGDGAAHRHPVRARREDLDGVGPPEPVMAVVGDPHHHLLAGQGVPDEEDPALVA